MAAFLDRLRRLVLDEAITIQFQPERLNVVVARPRKKLIVTGSSHVLSAAPIEPELQESAAVLRDLLGTCARRALDFAPIRKLACRLTCPRSEAEWG